MVLLPKDSSDQLDFLGVGRGSRGRSMRNMRERDDDVLFATQRSRPSSSQSMARSASAPVLMRKQRSRYPAPPADIHARLQQFSEKHADAILSPLYMDVVRSAPIDIFAGHMHVNYDGLLVYGSGGASSPNRAHTQRPATSTMPWTTVWGHLLETVLRCAISCLSHMLTSQGIW